MPVLGIAFDQNSAYWVMALGGTVLYVLKIVLVLIGGDHGGDGDVGGDGSTDHGSGDTFAVFSLQSVLAFFMGAGWMGLAGLNEWQLSPIATFFLAMGFGVVLMMLNAALMFGVNKLNQEVHYDIKSSIGHIGKVYLVIPKKGDGMGQVEMEVSGRHMVMKAVSEGDEIPSEKMVVVTDVRDGQILVVRPQA
ncbi:MAG: hypothetical protein ABI333_16675 [bacterium]